VLSSLAVQLAVATEGPALPESGVNLARASGGWLNVEAADNRLTLRFFDAEKKEVAPDVTRASARIVYPAREDRRGVLNREGDLLRSPATVSPPFVFRIHLSLFRDGASEPESFVVQYPGKETP
jgi:hypothetical protein